MTSPKSRDPKMDENTARFRSILAANEEEESNKPTPPPARSLLDILPRAPKRAESAPQPNQPGPKAAAKPVVPLAPVKQEPAPPSEKRRFGPAFWTVTGILSMIVNGVLIAVVILLLLQISRMNIQINQLTAYAKLPEDTVRGLYENFVKMDKAHIRTNIQVTTEIPVQFNLDLNTQTDVVLSQDTPINQARVTLTTGGLNISNAPANIILPAGTRLPVTLVLTVPVDKMVPVNLNVPVDIALSETDLHEPFVGLQTVVAPLYCLLNPQAMSPDGFLICDQAVMP